VAALAAGCGGTVLVDSEAGGGGEGGANGAGGEGGDIAVTTTSAATTTSTDTVTIPPAQVTQACLDYCAAIDETTSCYSLEDCHARCMSFYLPGCTAETESVLACVPEWLSGICQIGYPDDPWGGCTAAFDALTVCGQQAAGFCSYGYDLVGSTACTGEMSCSGTNRAVTCDSTGKCACTEDGMLVGGCAMPFAGAEACSLVYSCCQAFF
jgi:hypothetical protein